MTTWPGGPTDRQAQDQRSADAGEGGEGGGDERAGRLFAPGALDDSPGFRRPRAGIAGLAWVHVTPPAPLIVRRQTMRNTLAFLAAAVIAVAAVGYYLDWFSVRGTPSPNGHKK